MCDGIIPGTKICTWTLNFAQCTMWKKISIAVIKKMEMCVFSTKCHNYRTRATITRSWILTIHKVRILRKKPLEKTFLDFKKWFKSIQTAGYNGARTLFSYRRKIIHFSNYRSTGRNWIISLIHNKTLSMIDYCHQSHYT